MAEPMFKFSLVTNDQLKYTIAYAEEYFIRFIAQTIALVIFF